MRDLFEFCRKVILKVLFHINHDLQGLNVKVTFEFIRVGLFDSSGEKTTLFCAKLCLRRAEILSLVDFHKLLKKF